MSTKPSISRIFSVLLVLVFGLSVAPLQAAHASSRRYARPVASGSGDCSIWANACTLQTALTGALSGDEIWAAAGTHKPTTDPANRAATFQLISGVALYGGFAGTENVRDQRNPELHVTILSGDIDNNDSQTPIITDLTTVTGNTTNSYHIVTGATGGTLDGFIITADNANGEGITDYNDRGGGMFNNSSSPMLTKVIFNGNTAYFGGAMDNFTSSSPTLMDVTFSGNTATYGGGMDNYTSGSPTLENVTFSANTATDFGGGMSNFYSSSTTLANVTFSANTATYGGGMYNIRSSPTLTNVTFSANSAKTSGGGMYNKVGSNPQIRNTIFWGNSDQIDNYDSRDSPIVTDSVVQNGCPAGSICTNILTADPKLGTLGNYGGFTQTIPILAGSSAIDTGNDAVCPATDQRGVSRLQGAHCDIGAFEFNYFQIFLPLIIR